MTSMQLDERRTIGMLSDSLFFDLNNHRKVIFFCPTTERHNSRSVEVETARRFWLDGWPPA